MPHVKYTALLGNVNKSISNIDFGNGFQVKEWPIERFVKFYEELHGAAEHDIWFKLDNDWGYGHGGKYRPSYVYVVTKEEDDFPNIYVGKDMDKWNESFQRRLDFENKETDFLNNQITKLRLCAEGSIKICVAFFYSGDDGDLEMQLGSEEQLHCENRLFSVKKSDLKAINDFLKAPPLHPKHNYIAFALDNFSQSYRVAHIHLEFITLMIALEALFNDGKQELRHKVSRSCAVLLGKTKAASRQIYNDLKNLYDKRSSLVHTGDKSTVNRADTVLLNNYVRRGLLRVIDLNVPKQQLAMKLTENGFGSYSKIR